jgi:manganese-dependent inorganic pyrophosphatase
MEKKVYVIGHRNPDTDSVVSAVAYARLKQLLGHSSCVAARGGQASPQTKYIFERFGMELPELLPNLVPKAEHYISGEPVTVNENDSLWNALELMRKDDFKVLAVVDDGGFYKSVLHYRGFADYIIANINPRKKSAFPVSLNHLAASVHAQPVTLFNGDEVRKSPIVVAAAYQGHFVDTLRSEGAENAIVIVGDRWDIQEYSISMGVRAIILSNGTVLADGLAELAREKGVSVLISPFDTSSTAMLIIYSVAVGNLGDSTVPLVRLKDTVRSFRETISKARSRCLPVADEKGRVAGVIFEGQLVKEPNVEVIMVDHNELSQAVEGIENYRILEIIDHHRLGNPPSRHPITFINRVVGATCTIITNLYREYKIPFEKPIASILLCGILADTLSLKSETTTETDTEAADYLSSITGLDIKSLGTELLAAASQVASLSPEQLIAVDMKEYTEKGVSFTVSQIETDNPQALVDRRVQIVRAMEDLRGAGGHLFTALLVTDVSTLDSLFFITGEEAFTARIGFPLCCEGIYELAGVVSRKKQLLPLLAELVSRYTQTRV